MAQRIFDPIRIRYDGFDADDHLIEMSSLAGSLDGLSRILSSSAQYAVTLRHVQRADARQFQVYAVATNDHGCYDVLAAIGSVAGVAQPPILLPILQHAKPLYEALIGWIFAQHKKDNAAVDAMKEVSLKALEEMGLTARAQNEKNLAVMSEMVAVLHEAVKRAVQPVDNSCRQMLLYPTAPVIQTIIVDPEGKRRIIEDEPEELLATRPYEVLLSEIDIHTRGCRVSLSESDDQRIRGEIADPALTMAGDPYTSAMRARRRLRVLAKAVLDEHGEIKRLVISDTA